MSNGDTLSWGFDTEQEIHQSMFNQIDEVWLTLLGYDQYAWSGDTTGATLVLPRDDQRLAILSIDRRECRWTIFSEQL